MPEDSDQRTHWNRTYESHEAYFGRAPSPFALRALSILRENGCSVILEMGCGHGRDTLFFAENGLRMFAFDYAEEAVRLVRQQATEKGLTGRVEAECLDARGGLPYPDRSFDAVYGHMFFNMHLTRAESEAVMEEVKRALKPGGLLLYTVRNTRDPGYRNGPHLGEDIYVVQGFAVHFFDEDRVKRLARGFEFLNLRESEEGRREYLKRLHEAVLRMRPPASGLLTPSERHERVEKVGPWRLNVVSYRLGDVYVCTVDNVDPGAVLARGQALTREEAEAQALEKARERVSRTRIIE